MIRLKEHQERAVKRVLTRWQEAQELYRYDVSEADRATARQVASVMLEAPTGSGKTVMAGAIVEEFSAIEGVVWFWFAPFKGLVEQSGRFLRGQCKGLRVRDLRFDRHAGQVRSGDLYVTTWAAVAASNSEGRKVRQKHESLSSLDELIPLLRERGLRIGVVVDEAHHTFRRQTQALTLFREVLQPDYTLLVTATPDEAEMEAFAKELALEKPERVVVTREQAVAMGLVKRGIKAAAYLADPAVERIVDYEKTALADGWRMHCNIRQTLATAGIRLTPLMLVQVQTSGKRNDEQRVREKLIELGVPEGAIAVHTAQEPDPDVLAVAHDEKIEVLIFKMKVALGFDAPRAFVLVSSRASRKASFGIQVCGRILRVHSRLQKRRDLPSLLDFGYVFLADAESQEGLVTAAQSIDQVCDDFATTDSPTVMVIKIGERYTIQKVGAAGGSLLHGLDEEREPTNEAVTDWMGGAPVFNPHIPLARDSAGTLPGLEDIFTATEATDGEPYPQTVRRKNSGSQQLRVERYSYPRRSDVPDYLKTHLLPTAFDELADEIVREYHFSERMLLDGQRDIVRVTRREMEIFSGETERSQFDARLSVREIERLAQGYLFELDGPNHAVIREGLRRRLQQVYRDQGLETDDKKIKHALNLIMTLHPQALRTAMKQSLFRHSPVEETFEPLPQEMVYDERQESSAFNIYGIMPADLNSWEREFAALLDNDLSGTVRWWHRNPVAKRYSVCVPLSSGRGYYPDFVVALNGRRRGDGILLVETKERVYDPLAEEKVEAEHRFYGRPLMLTREGERFISIRYNTQRRCNESDRIFALDWVTLYE